MKNRNLKESFTNAFNGIIYTIKQERNIKIHLLVTIIVIVAGIYLRLSKIEFAVLLLTIGSVIVCELINTSVECLVDKLFQGYNECAKIVKDVAAGAVFFSSIVSLVVAYLIFYDKLFLELKKLFGG